MDICSYVAWFGIFSVLGWLYECTYCAIRTKKWDNRGFLFGPVCPIYGFGAVLVLLSWRLVPAGATPAWWQVFLASTIGSAILEYGTSYVLEKRFGARWWDYSDMPLNLDGRICLPFALCFGAAGTLLYYIVCPAVADATSAMPQAFWEMLALGTASLMSADLVLTEASLTSLIKRIETDKSGFDAKMETAVADLSEGRTPLACAVSDIGSVERHALKAIRSFSAPRRQAAAERLKASLSRTGTR